MVTSFRTIVRNLDELARDHGDPDALADAELSKAQEETIRAAALRIAAEQKRVNADALMRDTGCSRVTAQQALLFQRDAGKLLRTQRGVYVLPTANSEAQRARVELAKGIQATAQGQFTDPEAFCSHKDPLPRHVPDFEAPLLRRRRA